MTLHTEPSHDAARRPEGRLKNRSPELAARRAAWSARADQQAGPSRSTIYDWASMCAAPAVQLRAFDVSCADLHDAIAVGNHEVWGDPLPAHLPGGAVQLRARMAGERRDAEDPHRTAASGFMGGGGGLPHLGAIQRAFGRHDVSGVRAHVGGPASEAAQALGAEAYTSGDRIAFSSSPDLFLAAHEAAHVVQQRAGVSLPGGMGQVGDRYERHADEVAAMVVNGGNAESVLDRMVGGGGGAAIQCRSLPLSGADAGGRNAEPNYAEKNAEHHERQRLEAELAGKERGVGLGSLDHSGTRQFELVSVAISGTFPKAVGPADLTLKGLCKYEAAAVREGEGDSETELEAEIEVNLELEISVLKLYVGGTGRLRITLPGAVLAGELGASAMSQVVARAASHAVKACLQRDGGAILKRLSTVHAQAEAGWAAATEAYRAALVAAMTEANEEQGFGSFEADPVIARFVGVARDFTKGMLDLGAAKATRDAGGLPSGYTDLLRHLCSAKGVVAGLGIPPAGRLDKAVLGQHMNEAWRAGSAFDQIRATLRERAQGLTLPSMSVAAPPKFIGDLGLQVGFAAELGKGRPSAEGKAQALMRVKSAEPAKAAADPANGSSVDLEVGVRLTASVSVPMGKRTATFAAEYSRFGAPRGEGKDERELKVAGSIVVDASRPGAEVAQQVGESARAAIGGSGAALFEGKPDAGSLSAICRAFARNFVSSGERQSSTALEVEFAYDFKEKLTVKTLAKQSHGLKTDLVSASLEAGAGVEMTFKVPRRAEPSERRGASRG